MTTPDIKSLDPAAQEAFVNQAIPHVDARIKRYFQNSERVSSLVKLYEGVSDGPTGLNREDILRSAVVFLHATLEDYLRGLASTHLHLASENALNGIPLAGTGSSGRAEKFLLGRLVSHRGKSVDDVLRESVEQHLERSNFNSTAEVASLLTDLGFDLTSIRPTFPKLDDMMRRRHQIVHRADRPTTTRAGEVDEAQHLSAEQVNEWALAASTFLGKTLVQLSLTDAVAGRFKFEYPPPAEPRGTSAG